MESRCGESDIATAKYVELGQSRLSILGCRAHEYFFGYKIFLAIQKFPLDCLPQNAGMWTPQTWDSILTKVSKTRVGNFVAETRTGENNQLLPNRLKENFCISVSIIKQWWSRPCKLSVYLICPINRHLGTSVGYIFISVSILVVQDATNQIFIHFTLRERE